MLMEAFNKVLGPKDIGKIDQNLINVEPPRDKEHGDVATNVAMVFAKILSVKPRDLAIKICNELDRNDYVAAVKVAGPGFINIKLVDEVWFKSLHFILKSGKDNPHRAPKLPPKMEIFRRFTSAAGLESPGPACF